MSQQLGNIGGPPVDAFMGKRKVLLISLIFTPKELQSGLRKKIAKYWEQVKSQVTNLESKLGSAQKIYHELFLDEAEEKDQGKALEKINKESYELVRPKLDKGAKLQQIESAELLDEAMDWSRCLAAGLHSRKVAATVYELFSEASIRRYEYISEKINETLKENETGILLIMEGHQVRLAPDIEVLRISPPGLDEVKKSLMESGPGAQA